MIRIMLSFIILAICLLGTHTFNLHNHFSSGVVQNNTELFHELNNYIHQHNQDTLKSDPNFCKRQYVVGIYSCPEQIGNHVHEFLNSFVAAFVTNRTLLWHFCDRKPCKMNSQGDCDAFLTISPWIMKYDDFRIQWKKNECDGSADYVPISGVNHRHFSDEVAMCCKFDNTTLPIVTFGTYELHDFAALALPTALLKPESKRRAGVLFHKFGEHYAYGVLFRLSFKFLNTIVESNEETLRIAIDQWKKENATAARLLQNKPAFHIAIHMRHAAVTDEDLPKYDLSGYECVRTMVHQYQESMKDRACLILLAADRNDSLLFWKSKQEEFGCKLVITNHQASHALLTEHGPFTGEIAMRDLELLSRGDMFVGSSYQIRHFYMFVSSFSLLMSELIATNGREYSTSIPSRFLPECKPSIGSRRIPKNMYIENVPCPLAMEKKFCPGFLGQPNMRFDQY